MTRSIRRYVAPAWVLASLAVSAGAGELRGRLLLAGRAATGVTVAAVPYESPIDQARREARRQPAPGAIASVATDAEGAFVLPVAPDPGKEMLITVQFDGGGIVSAALDGFWGAAEFADLGDHVLAPGGALSGRVTDAAGAPVADAEVVLLPAAVRGGDPEVGAVPRARRTGPDGSFRFDGASATGNTLTVEKAGFIVGRLTGVKAGPLGAPVVLGKGTPVSGSVRGTDLRSPAAGALVRLEGRAVTRWVEADAAGSFTIPAAPAGTFTVVADGGEGGYVERDDVTLPLAQGATLDLVLRPTSAVVGRAVDARTGKPVPRVAITVRAPGRSRATRSTPDGTYALRGVPPGSWQLRADEPRFVPWLHASVPLRPGETKTIDVPLVLGASISGRVTDDAGRPVGDASGVLNRMGPISAQRVARRLFGGEPPVFWSRNDGTFKATRIAPASSALLVVSHPEFQQAALGGIVLAGGAMKAGMSIVLARGSTLTGQVKDGSGQPVSGAEVALTRARGLAGPGAGGPGRGAAVLGVVGDAPPETKRDTTGVDGKFSLRGVAVGEYVLTVERSGYASERVEPVRVPKSGAPAPLVVTLTPGASISGRVVHRSGSGAEGLVVRANSPGVPRFDPAAGPDLPTAPDGMFSIDGLRPGRSYDLQLFGSTGVGEGKRGVVAPASGVVLTVAGPGRIAGKAVDAADGHPITEFQVSYEAERGFGFRGPGRQGARGGAAGADAQSVSVQSADGAFAIDDVPAGRWSVVATSKGYQAGRTSGIEVTEGETTGGVEVRLAAGTFVKGRVVDATSNAPVANASVTITAAGARPGPGAVMTDAAGGDVTSDADGRFEIEGVAKGRQPLHVTHPDYTDVTQTVQVGEDGATVEVRMTAGGVLTGTVASESGQPVPGANVALVQAGNGGGFGPGGGAGAQTNVTDTAGAFRFDHLGAGRYRVEASLGSRTSTPVDVVLQAGQPPQDVVLQLQVGVTIQGTVSGLPAGMVNGMTVGANGPDSYAQSMRLGADGTFEFDNVPTGIVTLRGTATDPSGSTRSTTKQVATSADQPVFAVQLVFDQGFTLSGRVSQGGQPVSGAMVFASLQGGGGRQASATTDGGGSYQLTGLQEGTYTVNALSAQAGASQRQTIAVDSDQTLDIVFPSAKIAGRVVDAESNTALANATVAIRSDDPNAPGGPGQRPATTDTSGQFSFTGLGEVTYTLSTSRADYQVDTRDVAATDQGTDGLVITLTRAAGIGVKVQDGLSGVPLPSVMVRVFDTQSAPVFGPVPIALDSSGQGEIPSLPPGTYSVVAGASGYAPVQLDGVAVPSATVAIYLTPGGTLLIQAGPKTLAKGTVTGTIASATGRPALLSLFNLDGRFAVSEPNVQLRNVPPGSYVLSLPSLEVSQPFTVGEGAVATVPLP